jgi:hypothetical protein
LRTPSVVIGGVLRTFTTANQRAGAVKDSPEPESASPKPYFPGSNTKLWALAASTAAGLKGSVNVVPSYHAFHWSM